MSMMTINHHRGVQHTHILPLFLKRQGHSMSLSIYVWTQSAVLVGFHQVFYLEFQLYFLVI